MGCPEFCPKKVVTMCRGAKLDVPSWGYQGGQVGAKTIDLEWVHVHPTGFLASCQVAKIPSLSVWLGSTSHPVTVTHMKVYSI